MIKKHILICCIVIFNLKEVQSWSIEGIWIPKDKFNRIVNNSDYFITEESEEGLPNVFHNVYGMTSISSEENYIFYYDNDILKCNFDAHPFFIENLVYFRDDSLRFEIYDIFFEEKILIDIIKIDFITEDKINFQGENQIWNFNQLIKISSPAKISIQPAILNDSRVRVRTQPNLNSDTWGLLNKGDYVKVKDKALESFEINGESWFWYKVESENLPDGWVYGKYLDIKDSDFEISQKTKSKEIIPKSEILETLYSQGDHIKHNSQNSRKKEKNTYFNINEKFYSYYGNTFDKKNRILTIINDKVLLPCNLKIGQSESELKEILGEPDSKINNSLIYKYGEEYMYIAKFEIINECVNKIEVQYRF